MRPISLSSYFLAMIYTVIAFCHPVLALELGDRIQFYDATSKSKLIGVVTEYARSTLGKKVTFVKIEGSGRKIEAPKGQYLILESPSAHGWIPDSKTEEVASFELPKSILNNEYYCDEQTCSSPLRWVLGLLEEETPFWSRYNKVIFLAEGGDSNWEGRSWHIPFATALHRAYPSLQIIKTDLDKEERHSSDSKLIELPVNHTHSFARSVVGSSEKADAVIMLRGLCHCGIINGNSSTTCGGLDTTRQSELQKFLIQTLELVEWKNPRSFVYLEGHHFSGPFENKKSNFKEHSKHFRKRILRQSRALNRWKNAATKVSQMYGINFYFEYLENGDFKGIVFRPY